MKGSSGKIFDQEAASYWRWGKAREGRESLASREFMPRAKVGAQQGQKTGPEATSRR